MPTLLAEGFVFLMRSIQRFPCQKNNPFAFNDLQNPTKVPLPAIVMNSQHHQPEKILQAIVNHEFFYTLTICINIATPY